MLYLNIECFACKFVHVTDRYNAQIHIPKKCKPPGEKEKILAKWSKAEKLTNVLSGINLNFF